ncbi:MAG TPA: transposase [Terriglobia bacterium]|nr:transposase [Terriglobia bacterium]
MKGPSPRGLWKYAARRLRLAAYLGDPGDGRSRPRIPAPALLWSLVMGLILRQSAFRAIEAWVGSRARQALRVSRAFGDDALRYFTERLDPAPTRAALASVLRRAKRNKAFEDCRFVGLALDGTAGGRRRKSSCGLCRPYRNPAREIIGYRHHLVLAAVVGGELTLPVDVEPYGPGDSEYAAGLRLLRRVRASLGARFIDYVAVDGAFATAPFLHAAGEAGWPVVARLKDHLPELFRAAQRRFRSQPPHLAFCDGSDRVEIWDADDFDPWNALRWDAVRVIRYRQCHPNGEAVEAYWLTNLPSRRVGRRSLYAMAKSRWQIENQGFNDAKNRYGLEHICDHHPHSLLIVWLLTCLALTLERLYRLRYLHRGPHPVRTAIELLRLLQFSLLAPAIADFS